MTGAKILLECLKREGVKHMFGYPGGVVIPIFHELRNYKSIKFYLVRHEQAAAHAADGYARATGKVGVCLATSGPGATNLVTGIATAFMDSVPMVAITGQVRSQLLGTDAFQEADITGITRPITKYNFLVRDVKDLAMAIREAFHIASTGRPGPVLVDIPVDVSNGETEFVFPESVNIKGYKPTYEGHPLQIKRMAEAIAKAQKPVICAGGGVILSQATAELKKIAEKCHIPVATTLMGMGAFPGTNPLFIGMPGMHGTRTANMAFADCDLLFAVGMRFDDRVTGNIALFAPKATIVHVDIDPASISKNVKVHIPVVGDAKIILKELDRLLKPTRPSAWNATVARWQKKHPLSYKQEKNGAVKPQYVIETLYRLTRGKAIIATEVGQNQMWASQYYKYDDPRTFLSSGGLGTMGYGFPAAMGAQVGLPGAMVFDIAGDGSIQMNIQELATVAVNNIPVKIVILNNQYLGMVRQWQELFYGKNYAGTCLSRNYMCPADCANPSGKCPNMVPDFVKVAQAYGILGIHVDKVSQVEPALKKAMAHQGPVVVEVKVAREENVYPMVPAGKSITEMLEG